MNSLTNLKNPLATRLLREAERKDGKEEQMTEREGLDYQLELAFSDDVEFNARCDSPERANAFRAKEAGGVEAIPIEGAPPQEFVKAEKNLETLGFFTPSSNWTKDVKKKVISFTITIDGKKVKASATILPSAEYGLPDTADLDKYRAFQKILSDELIKNGKVPKCITFTSMDLIQAMGKKRKGGEIYGEIRDWLMRMKLTGIQSEGAVWLAGKKTWVTDTVSVFDRVVVHGQELDDGIIADSHYVWLSDWQLENINEYWLLSIDYDLHKQLRKPIAKSLLPLLQIGFYASGGTYTKRYDQLCQFLGVTNHKRFSYIKRQLEPSFKDLHGKGFLDNWDYGENKLHNTHNIIWWAGDRFYEMQELLQERERKLTEPVSRKPKRLTRPKPTPDKAQQPEVKTETLDTKPEREVSPSRASRNIALARDDALTPRKPQLSSLAQELVERGISESVAIDFIESFPDEYLVEKIEMHDVNKATGEITTNAAGWLREAITRDFKLSEEQQSKLQAKAERKEEEEREEKLRAEAKEIQEQRLKEIIANFPEKDEWVEGRVQYNIEVRNLMAESKMNKPLTDEEIEERRRIFNEQYPITEEDRRKWLVGNDTSCKLEDIMNELKSGEENEEITVPAREA